MYSLHASEVEGKA